MTFNKDWQQTIKEGVLSFGVQLNQEQLELLTLHAKELIKWNSKFNITAIVKPFDVALKHFIDSIAIAPFVPNNSKLIDLGSGGGFPGLPLKVVNPSLEIVMADSSEKKVIFIKYLIGQFGLINQNYSKGAKAVHCRAEELAKSPEYASKFDCVVSRAFTSLERFTDMALPFLKPDGVILAMKGQLEPDELNAITSRHDIKTEIHEYSLPFESYKRSIVTICSTSGQLL